MKTISQSERFIRHLSVLDNHQSCEQEGSCGDAPTETGKATLRPTGKNVISPKGAVTIEVSHERRARQRSGTRRAVQ